MLDRALQEELMSRCRKWVCRDADGKWYVLRPKTLRDRRQTFVLHLSAKEQPENFGDFSVAVRLFSQGGTIQRGETISSAAITIDGSNALTLVCCTGQGMIRAQRIDLHSVTRPKHLRESSRWQHPVTGRTGALTVCAEGGALGDLAIDTDGSVWMTWLESADGRSQSLMLAKLGGKKWSPFPLHKGPGLFPAALCFDSQNQFHLVWNDILEDLYSLSGTVGTLGGRQEWKPKQMVDRAKEPALVSFGNEVMAAYENNWCFLEYVFPKEKKPERQFLTWPDPRFTWDINKGCQLVLDRYGIPWLFYNEDTRQHIFCARWLGTTWSPLQNCAKLIQNSSRFTENHLSIDHFAVEQNPTGESIGLLLCHQRRWPRVEFQPQKVPALKADAGKKVLFFDLMELQAWDNLQLNLNEVKKYKGNPVIESEGPEAFDAHGAGGFVQVLKEEGRYRMWYGGIYVEPEKYWGDWCRIGYAESKDGLQFHRVPLGLASWKGKKDTNIIPELPYVPHVYFDPHDPDPDRRYKVLKIRNHVYTEREMRAGREDLWQTARTGFLFVSADGIHWKKESATLTFLDTVEPYELVPQSIFCDPLEPDPEKRYKYYGYSSLNVSRRGGCYAYSPDGRTWTACANNPVLDPFARGIPVVRSGKVHQIHDTVVFPYEGYYLALYQYQHNGEKLDIELAVSRDGEHFTFVCPGSKVIPLGRKGSQESTIVAPSVPLIDGKEIQLYYGGIGENGIRRAGHLGTLRLDGFTHLERKDVSREGSLTTIPIASGTARQVFVNCRAGRGSCIEAEVLNPATGKPVPGYSRKACTPIASNRLSQVVQWKGKKGIVGLNIDPFQIRFHFTGDGALPELYSFLFA
ncbi:MAG: hypothetical protein CO095_02260 [Armatimonadetes bacterium CG_4_9_14_3_um_filter_58_7]|nr:MAG: hypothetical protein CO095_02260 [Armatimonadetes bacterium CG_4_9_14_3_um_filter_58_7]